MSQPDANPPADFTVSLPDSWRTAAEQRGGPAERIAVIEDSLCCYTYGWLSCLPLLGAVYLYPAVRRFAQARRRLVEWNPARGYLAAGLALASVGWMMSLLTWWMFVSAQAAVGEATGSDVSMMKLLPAVLFFGCPPAVAGLVVAGATVCPRLAEFASLSLWGVVLISLGISAAIIVTVRTLASCWREGQFESPPWFDMVGLGLWAVWLLVGFIVLALRKTSLSVWAAWLIGAAILTFAFALA